jgi:hypothetical protein
MRRLCGSQALKPGQVRFRFIAMNWEGKFRAAHIRPFGGLLGGDYT